MATYVALLRGVNVAGAGKVGMADLRQVFADAGHTDVQTYIQTGNVVFAARGSASRIAPELEQRIASELGLTTTVLLRSASDLTRVARNNPFVDRGADPSSLHVTFLNGAAGRDAPARLDVPGAAPDELVVSGKEVYVHCPNGYGRTKLNNTFVERRLGVQATTRNWRTLTKLLDLATS
jgi:uncharacterized protein (DUF1697 family)